MGVMRVIGAILAFGLLAGCVVPASQMPAPAPLPVAQQAAPRGLPPDQAVRNFVTAVAAVEPVAEAFCRQRTRNVPCDFQIVVDSRAGQAPNAFQTLDPQGRPVLGFTLSLIGEARNLDEIAFIMGHEAAHHILGHIPAQQQSAAQGALLAGVLASLGGGGVEAVQSAQQLGATLGARRFSKDFELQADALGTEITEAAGFDALRGAEFFARIPDPGDQFLGTHPPNAERQATVARVVAATR